jgi:hypothetical protein
MLARTCLRFSNSYKRSRISLISYLLGSVLEKSICECEKSVTTDLVTFAHSYAEREISASVESHRKSWQFKISANRRPAIFSGARDPPLLAQCVPPCLLKSGMAACTPDQLLKRQEGRCSGFHPMTRRKSRARAGPQGSRTCPIEARLQKGGRARKSTRPGMASIEVKAMIVMKIGTGTGTMMM